MDYSDDFGNFKSKLDYSQRSNNKVLKLINPALTNTQPNNKDHNIIRQQANPLSKNEGADPYSTQ